MSTSIKFGSSVKNNRVDAQSTLDRWRKQRWNITSGGLENYLAVKHVHFRKYRFNIYFLQRAALKIQHWYFNKKAQDQKQQHLSMISNSNKHQMVKEENPLTLYEKERHKMMKAVAEQTNGFNESFSSFEKQRAHNMFKRPTPNFQTQSGNDSVETSQKFGSNNLSINNQSVNHRKTSQQDLQLEALKKVYEERQNRNLIKFQNKFLNKSMERFNQIGQGYEEKSFYKQKAHYSKESFIRKSISDETKSLDSKAAVVNKLRPSKELKETLTEEKAVVIFENYNREKEFMSRSRSQSKGGSPSQPHHHDLSFLRESSQTLIENQSPVVFQMNLKQTEPFIDHSNQKPNDPLVQWETPIQDVNMNSTISNGYGGKITKFQDKGKFNEPLRSGVQKDNGTFEQDMGIKKQPNPKQIMSPVRDNSKRSRSTSPKHLGKSLYQKNKDLSESSMKQEMQSLSKHSLNKDQTSLSHLSKKEKEHQSQTKAQSVSDGRTVQSQEDIVEYEDSGNKINGPQISNHKLTFPVPKKDTIQPILASVRDQAPKLLSKPHTERVKSSTKTSQLVNPLNQSKSPAQDSLQRKNQQNTTVIEKKNSETYMSTLADKSGSLSGSQPQVLKSNQPGTNNQSSVARQPQINLVGLKKYNNHSLSQYIQYRLGNQQQQAQSQNSNEKILNDSSQNNSQVRIGNNSTNGEVGGRQSLVMQKAIEIQNSLNVKPNNQMANELSQGSSKNRVESQKQEIRNDPVMTKQHQTEKQASITKQDASENSDRSSLIVQEPTKGQVLNRSSYLSQNFTKEQIDLNSPSPLQKLNQTQSNSKQDMDYRQRLLKTADKFQAAFIDAIDELPRAYPPIPTQFVNESAQSSTDSAQNNNHDKRSENKSVDMLRQKKVNFNQTQILDRKQDLNQSQPADQDSFTKTLRSERQSLLENYLQSKKQKSLQQDPKATSNINKGIKQMQSPVANHQVVEFKVLKLKHPKMNGGEFEKGDESMLQSSRQLSTSQVKNSKSSQRYQQSKGHKSHLSQTMILTNKIGLNSSGVEDTNSNQGSDRDKMKSSIMSKNVSQTTSYRKQSQDLNISSSRNVPATKNSQQAPSHNLEQTTAAFIASKATPEPKPQSIIHQRQVKSQDRTTESASHQQQQLSSTLQQHSALKQPHLSLHPHSKQTDYMQYQSIVSNQGIANNVNNQGNGLSSSVTRSNFSQNLMMSTESVLRKRNYKYGQQIQ